MLSKSIQKVKLNHSQGFSRQHIPGLIHHAENCPFSDQAVLSKRQSVVEAATGQQQRTTIESTAGVPESANAEEQSQAGSEHYQSRRFRNGSHATRSNHSRGFADPQ